MAKKNPREKVESTGGGGTLSEEEEEEEEEEPDRAMSTGNDFAVTGKHQIGCDFQVKSNELSAISTNDFHDLLKQLFFPDGFSVSRARACVRGTP